MTTSHQPAANLPSYVVRGVVDACFRILLLGNSLRGRLGRLEPPRPLDVPGRGRDTTEGILGAKAEHHHSAFRSQTRRAGLVQIFS